MTSLFLIQVQHANADLLFREGLIAIYEKRVFYTFLGRNFFLDIHFKNSFKKKRKKNILCAFLYESKN